jgi:uncharacterized protein (TIGR00645 family)
MIEKLIERTLYQSRWLLAPVYLGLSLCILAISIKFFEEIAHLITGVFVMNESELVLVILSLIDLTLIGNLIIMVMFSGYENFVSKISISENDEKLHWFGKLDASAVKQKVSASIVAISSIHLLKVFMNVEKIPNDKLLWYVVIHIVFVMSTVGLAYVEKIHSHSKDH